MAGVLCGAGLVTYEAVTQVASAAAPPVITTGYAAYPPANAIPANCAGGPTVTGGGEGVLTNFRGFIDPATRTPAQAASPASDFVDPGPNATDANRIIFRFQGRLVPGNRVVIRWTNWAANCGGLTISFPLKATNPPQFVLGDDQALVREPNGPYTFPFCNQATDPCPGPAGVGGFQLSTVVPQLSVVCGYQLDVVIGGPLETVGPHGSYYATSNRQAAVAAGLGTFNTNGPNMLIDRANGAMPCASPPRIAVDKEWVGTGAQPPSNVPAGFQLTVTSSTSATDPTVLTTATCTVVSSAFICDYRDAANPGQPQGGLLVNNESLLTVTETGFPGNTVDITFPVGMASKYVHCAMDPATGNFTGACLLTITNAPPPPPPTTVPPTTAPTTVPPDAPTTVPTTSPITVTLPPTGSSGPAPLTILGLALIPAGALLILLTRRRADQI
jgi:hypothetical protein